MKDKQRLATIRENVDEVCIMTECRWMQMRKHLTYKSKLSKFLSREKVTTEQILQAVESGDFFGICKVKISTPDNIIQKYEALNFPFIFDKKQVTIDMLDSKMRELATNAHREFPYTTTTLCYNSDNRILATPLLQFYLKLGLKVDTLYYAIEYLEDRPFTKFVDELVDVRIKCVGVNQPAGDR